MERMNRIIVVVLLILCGLWWWLSQGPAKPIKPINQVSLKNSATEQQAEHQTIKQKLKTRDVQANSSQQNIVPKETMTDDDWSYLAIYRRLEWADVCSRYHWFAFTHKDNPFESYLDELNERYMNINGEHLNAHVLAKVTQYPLICERLKKAVMAYLQLDEIDRSKGQSVVTELKQLLSATPAVTEKEKRLKAHFELAQSFLLTQTEFKQIKNQTAKISKQEHIDIRREISALDRELSQLDMSMGIEAMTARYHALVTQITALNDQLENKYDFENKSLQEVQGRLLNQWVDLQGRLIGDDPDVFKVVKMASEWATNPLYMGMGVSGNRAELGIPLKSPGEQMMAEFGIEANTGFALAANPAAVLYLCSLGYDCSEDSPLAMKLCLQSYLETPAACHASVESFYLNHALSPNLLDDVLMIFRWMEDNYGT